MSRNHNWPEGQIGRRKRTAGICVAAWAVLLPALARAQTYNISLIAGTLPNPPSTTPVAGFTGDSGQALNAELDAPTGVWVDSNHNIYIVDKDNDRIRMISSSGIINTVAGSSTAEVYAGDGGKATQASLSTAQWNRLRQRGQPVYRGYRKQRGPQGDQRHHHDGRRE